MSSHRSAWPFHEPVDTTIVVDYLEFIKDPVDLTLIAKRIESGQYTSKTALRADLDLMCNNCMVYNTPDTNYYKCVAARAGRLVAPIMFRSRLTRALRHWHAGLRRTFRSSSSAASRSATVHLPSRERPRAAPRFKRTRGSNASR